MTGYLSVHTLGMDAYITVEYKSVESIVKPY